MLEVIEHYGRIVGLDKKLCRKANSMFYLLPFWAMTLEKKNTFDSNTGKPEKSDSYEFGE